MILSFRQQLLHSGRASRALRVSRKSQEALSIFEMSTSSCAAVKPKSQVGIFGELLFSHD